eukprot:jgi/Ulvmu1/7342/UM036_0002.1
MNWSNMPPPGSYAHVHPPYANSNEMLTYTSAQYSGTLWQQRFPNGPFDALPRIETVMSPASAETAYGWGHAMPPVHAHLQPSAPLGVRAEGWPSAAPQSIRHDVATNTHLRDVPFQQRLQENLSQHFGGHATARVQQPGCGMACAQTGWPPEDRSSLPLRQAAGSQSRFGPLHMRDSGTGRVDPVMHQQQSSDLGQSSFSAKEGFEHTFQSFPVVPAMAKETDNTVRRFDAYDAPDGGKTMYAMQRGLSQWIQQRSHEVKLSLGCQSTAVSQTARSGALPRLVHQDEHAPPVARPLGGPDAGRAVSIALPTPGCPTFQAVPQVASRAWHHECQPQTSAELPQQAPRRMGTGKLDRSLQCNLPPDPMRQPKAATQTHHATHAQPHNCGVPPSLPQGAGSLAFPTHPMGESVLTLDRAVGAAAQVASGRHAALPAAPTIQSDVAKFGMRSVEGSGAHECRTVATSLPHPHPQRGQNKRSSADLTYANIGQDIITAADQLLVAVPHIDDSQQHAIPHSDCLGRRANDISDQLLNGTASDHVDSFSPHSDPMSSGSPSKTGRSSMPLSFGTSSYESRQISSSTSGNMSSSPSLRSSSKSIQRSCSSSEARRQQTDFHAPSQSSSLEEGEIVDEPDDILPAVPPVPSVPAGPIQFELTTPQKRPSMRVESRAVALEALFTLTPVPRAEDNTTVADFGTVCDVPAPPTVMEPHVHSDAHGSENNSMLSAANRGRTAVVSRCQEQSTLREASVRCDSHVLPPRSEGKQIGLVEENAEAAVDNTLWHDQLSNATPIAVCTIETSVAVQRAGGKPHDAPGGPRSAAVKNQMKGSHEWGCAQTKMVLGQAVAPVPDIICSFGKQLSCVITTPAEKLHPIAKRAVRDCLLESNVPVSQKCSAEVDGYQSDVARPCVCLDSINARVEKRTNAGDMPASDEGNCQSYGRQVQESVDMHLMMAPSCKRQRTNTCDAIESNDAADLGAKCRHQNFHDDVTVWAAAGPSCSSEPAKFDACNAQASLEVIKLVQPCLSMPSQLLQSSICCSRTPCLNNMSELAMKARPSVDRELDVAKELPSDLRLQVHTCNESATSGIQAAHDSVQLNQLKEKLQAMMRGRAHVSANSGPVNSPQPTVSADVPEHSAAEVQASVTKPNTDGIDADEIAIIRQEHCASDRQPLVVMAETDMSGGSGDELGTSEQERPLVCLEFCQTGRCSIPHCKRVHDAGAVVPCGQMLSKGRCLDSNCRLQHRRARHLMPMCIYHFKGFCRNKDQCQYAHMHSVRPDAPICADFLRGYCHLGERCLCKHLSQSLVRQYFYNPDKYADLIEKSRQSGFARFGPSIGGAHPFDES